MLGRRNNPQGALLTGAAGKEVPEPSPVLRRMESPAGETEEGPAGQGGLLGPHRSEQALGRLKEQEKRRRAGLRVLGGERWEVRVG